MKTIIPEISEIVNFYSPELIEQIARETGFVQRESKLGGVEFLALMTQGLYAHPDATMSFCEFDVWFLKDGRELMVRLIAERAPEGD